LAAKSTKSFDARNGHIEIDVNFASRRLVLTGTEAGLTLMGFDGIVLSHLKDATLQRNLSVEFSPSGKRVVVGSSDNAVYVYEIVE
jgi:WD40 repeat protein